MTDTPNDVPTTAPSERPSTPSPSGSAKHRSDRLLGFLCLAFGAWYVFETSNFAVTAFGTGPVGPKTLPRLLGTLFAIFALGLLIRPEESPSWGSRTVWMRMTAVVATSFFFGQALETVGFIIASTILAVVIGLFFKGPILKLAPLSVVFAVVVAFIFNNWLELRLPAGWWGGF